MLKRKRIEGIFLQEPTKIKNQSGNEIKENIHPKSALVSEMPVIELKHQ